jgi:hypothetical protein
MASSLLSLECSAHLVPRPPAWGAGGNDHDPGRDWTAVGARVRVRVLESALELHCQPPKNHNRNPAINESSDPTNPNDEANGAVGRVYGCTEVSGWSARQAVPIINSINMKVYFICICESRGETHRCTYALAPLYCLLSASLTTVDTCPRTRPTVLQCTG